MRQHGTASVSLVALAAVAIGIVSGCAGPPRLKRASVTRTFVHPAEEPEIDVRGSADLVTADGLPGESYAMLAPDGAWSWYGGPRAVSVVGEHARTFAGFVTSAGDITLAQFDHGSGLIERHIVNSESRPDDQASPALLVRPDYRLMVFHSGHRGRWMVCVISAGPEDITTWGEPRAASGHTSAYAGHTYPNAALLEGEDERRYVFWRGEKYRTMFSSSEMAKDWSAPVVLIEDEHRPFFKTASDGDGTIHFAFTDDHPANEAANSIHYLCYRDGSFRRADGTTVATMEDLPIGLDDTELVYDASASGVRSCLWDLAFDESGRPVIAYTAFPEENDHRYRYARWDGDAWQDGEIAPDGGAVPTGERRPRHFDPYASGGAALDPADPSTVYLSRLIDGVFEIERWVTDDGGATWVSAAVTSGSASDNIRPVVPSGHVPGGPGLIWMSGSYEDYTNSSTALRMK